jgi:hypothetical protein
VVTLPLEIRLDGETTTSIRMQLKMFPIGAWVTTAVSGFARCGRQSSTANPRSTAWLLQYVEFGAEQSIHSSTCNRWLQAGAAGEARAIRSPIRRTGNEVFRGSGIGAPLGSTPLGGGLLNIDCADDATS